MTSRLMVRFPIGPAPLPPEYYWIWSSYLTIVQRSPILYGKTLFNKHNVHLSMCDIMTFNSGYPQNLGYTSKVLNFTFLDRTHLSTSNFSHQIVENELSECKPMKIVKHCTTVIINCHITKTSYFIDN